MKQLFLVLLLTATFFSCKKEEATTVAPKKTYTVEYNVVYIGQPLSQCTIYYVQNGVTYNKVLTIPSGQVRIDWSTSFTANSGDYVSMNATPPYSSTFNNSVSLYIYYNGIYFNSSSSQWPSSASCNGNLP